MKTTSRRKQRKAMYNLPLHQRYKQLGVHLSRDLRKKYKKRSITVIKGDTVKIMRGGLKGHEEKVTLVNTKKGAVFVEKVTNIKADGKLVPRGVQHSNLMITKINLEDPLRRAKLEGE